MLHLVNQSFLDSHSGNVAAGKEYKLRTRQSRIYQRWSIGDRSEDPGLEVIKLEFILGLKIKCNDWLLADTSANHCALF